MPKTIRQTVTFPVPPHRLYHIYLSPREHSAACGWGTAKITPRVGGRMEVASAIRGKFLWLVPGRVVVQTWRGSYWKRSELDSVLFLLFERRHGGCRLVMVHANVPDAHAAGITRGWRKYYWRPWTAYLKGKAARRRARR